MVDSAAPVILLFHEFIQMLLHVNLDLMARFAGKCGEEEAHHAYKTLQSWRPTKGARIAIVHAGQVIRAARLIPPYQLRGSDSFTIYHAIMVLWTYSMLTRDHANKTAPGTPTTEKGIGHEDDAILLDEPRSNVQGHIDAFVLADRGRPCLKIISSHAYASPGPTDTVPEAVCDMRFPSQVMEVGIKLFEASVPGTSREIGPPLLQALCGLMEELGKIQ